MSEKVIENQICVSVIQPDRKLANKRIVSEYVIQTARFQCKTIRASCCSRAKRNVKTSANISVRRGHRWKMLRCSTPIRNRAISAANDHTMAVVVCGNLKASPSKIIRGERKKVKVHDFQRLWPRFQSIQMGKAKLKILETAKKKFEYSSGFGIWLPTQVQNKNIHYTLRRMRSICLHQNALKRPYDLRSRKKENEWNGRIKKKKKKREKMSKKEKLTIKNAKNDIIRIVLFVNTHADRQ